MDAVVAINLVLALLAEGGPISMLIDRARAEGRTITKEELDKLFAEDDDARDELADAIEKAKSEGR